MRGEQKRVRGKKKGKRKDRKRKMMGMRMGRKKRSTSLLLSFTLTYRKKNTHTRTLKLPFSTLNTLSPFKTSPLYLYPFYFSPLPLSLTPCLPSTPSIHPLSLTFPFPHFYTPLPLPPHLDLWWGVVSGQVQGQQDFLAAGTWAGRVPERSTTHCTSRRHSKGSL